MADNITIGGVTFRSEDLGALGQLLMFGLANQAGDDAIGPILASLAAATSADDAFTITPNDNTVFDPIPKAIYVVADGSLSMRGSGANAKSFGSVKAGQIIPFRARRVMASTTATVLGLV